MKKILFRADGDASTGLGHLYRIFALFEIYKKRYTCVLVTRETSRSFVPAEMPSVILPSGLKTMEEPEWLEHIYDPSEYWIVADGYQFNGSWQKAVKKAAFKLMYVDDMHVEHMYADLVVNHAMNVSTESYRTEFYTRLALGPAYAILRPPFLEAAKAHREIIDISKAFVCFGGADTYDLTLKAVKALMSFELVKEIDVVVGAAYLHEEIFDLAKKNSLVHVFRNLSGRDLAKLMKSCDFAIAPSSTILYELCSIKMPVISGYYVENQKNIYEGCVKNNLVFPGGNFENFEIGDFKNRLKDFFAKNDWMTYVFAQAKMFDAGIEDRFLHLLEELNYRRAEQGDIKLVFDWSNEKLSRANSYFSDPIPFETHQVWFEKKLKDANCFIYIAEWEGKSVGMVRYEIGEDYTTVGVLVGAEFRGRGLAQRMLKETALVYFSTNAKPVHAFIKTSNLASVKNFQRAGYHLLKEEVVHGALSFVYKLNKENVQ